MKLASTSAVASAILITLTSSAATTLSTPSSLLATTCHHINSTDTGPATLSTAYSFMNSTVTPIFSSSPLPSSPRSVITGESRYNTSAASMTPSSDNSRTVTVSYDWPCYGFGGCTPVAVTITDPPKPTTRRQKCHHSICHPLSISKGSTGIERETERKVTADGVADLLRDGRGTLTTVISAGS